MAEATLTLRMTSGLADMLRVNSMRNFYAEQADRFAPVGRFDLPLPNDPVFDGGTMHWCESGADALLLRAYEEACGWTVTVLGDESGEPSWVVLTSNPWAAIWKGRTDGATDDGRGEEGGA